MATQNQKLIAACVIALTLLETSSGAKTSVGKNISSTPDDDLLEEASGLPQAAPSNNPPKSSSTASDHRDELTEKENLGNVRQYALLEAGVVPKSRVDSRPVARSVAEWAATFSFYPTDGFTLFGDSRLTFNSQADNAKGQGHIDQLGIRWRPIDRLIFVVGKERNRRSPGLIVSPSDFIHTSQNLPGIREVREGVWQVRAGFQKSDFSLELVHLPVKVQSGNGMPANDTGERGSLIRFLGRLPYGIDLGIDAGKEGDSLKKGAFVQSLIFDVWKTYLEWGFDGANDAESHLLGLSFEGLTDSTIRAEIYQKNLTWQNASPLFRDQRYGMISLSLTEWLNQFNFTESLVSSMESNSLANILRAEWLASSRNVLGTNVQHFVQGSAYQWQGGIDFKTNF